MLPKNSAVVISGASIQYRNADSSYAFRQDSNFWYLSGFNEAESTLVLLINENNDVQSIAFVPEKDQLKECLHTLNRIKGLPQFEWVQDMIIKIDSTFNLNDNANNIIGFEQNIDLHNINLITDLYYKIVNKRPITIKYNISFKKIEQLTCHPYFLKQYKVATRFYSKNKLARIFGYLREYDLKSKGVGNYSSSENELMKELIFKIMH